MTLGLLAPLPPLLLNLAMFLWLLSISIFLSCSLLLLLVLMDSRTSQLWLSTLLYTLLSLILWKFTFWAVQVMPWLSSLGGSVLREAHTHLFLAYWSSPCLEQVLGRLLDESFFALWPDTSTWPGDTGPQPRADCHVCLKATMKGSRGESGCADTAVGQACSDAVKHPWRNAPLNCPTN